MALIEIKNLEFAYPRQTEKTLCNINLSIKEGEFFVLCGESGSGKSTLLRQIKRELAPFGKKSGQILYNGVPVEKISERTAAGEIGFVMQNPDNQIVTDKVWHELAFGLESLGVQPGVIRRRVAEMASFFGIQQWFHKNVNELSGGQKQMLNLASVMVMQPKVLILDEPTSQLDPISSKDFLETVMRINRELSLTVLLTEHRLEEVLSAADRIAVMEKGRVVCCGEPRAITRELSGGEQRRAVFEGFPAAARIHAGLGGRGDCPLTVREGSGWLSANCEPLPRQAEKAPPGSAEGRPAAELRNIWFKYGRNEPDILKGLSMKVYAGKICCILGGNGTGKTTALGVLAGLHKAYRGRVLIEGKPIADYKAGELYRGTLSMLPQNPQALFVQDTVRADLLEAAEVEGTQEDFFERIVDEMGLEPLLERHPYDLSGGEQQKAAFAKVLLRRPKVILLDEPTKGMDAHFKRKFGEMLRRLAGGGASIVMATHDLEFAAEYAHRCALFFDGGIVSEDDPVSFFAGNNFYTTAANRMVRNLLQEAITCEDVIKRCRIK